MLFITCLAPSFSSTKCDIPEFVGWLVAVNKNSKTKKQFKRITVVLSLATTIDFMVTNQEYLLSPSPPLPVIDSVLFG